MRDEVDRIRYALAAVGPRRRGARVPTGLRAAIAAYARRVRAHGASLDAVAATIGVSPESIRRWTQVAAGSSRPRGLVPVVLCAEPAPADRAMTVTAPGGYRVEGLTLPEVATLLRALA